LASILATYSNTTTRMYANSNGWELKEVKLDTELKRTKSKIIQLSSKSGIIGKLDGTLRQRLLKRANNCPYKNFRHLH
jgi:uncharacterized OsmC-like protein